MVVTPPKINAMLDGSGVASLDSETPQGIAWLWLFGVGFWASLSHICMTYALKFAPTSTLAPLHYLEIVAAVALGYLVFNDYTDLSKKSMRKGN